MKFLGMHLKLSQQGASLKIHLSAVLKNIKDDWFIKTILISTEPLFSKSKCHGQTAVICKSIKAIYNC